MSSDLEVMSVRNLKKTFKLYSSPLDRITEKATFGKMKKHMEFKALDGVDFSLKRGDVVGLIGSNGSGKSTLLQIMAGTMFPNEGYVEFDGKLTALLQLGAGFMPEVTGRENAILAARIYGMSERQAKEKIDWIIDFSEVGNHIDTPVKYYSSGMYSRLAFSVAVAVHPDIILIDEALSVGDLGFQKKAEKHLMTTLGDSAKIIVSHDLDSLKRHCTRGVVLNKGRIVFDGSMGEAVDVMRGGLETVLNTEKGAEIRGFKDIELVGFTFFCNGYENQSRVLPGDKIDMVFELNNGLEDAKIVLNYSWRDKYGRSIFGGTTHDKNHLSLKSGKVRLKVSLVWPVVQSGAYEFDVKMSSIEKNWAKPQIHADGLVVVTCPNENKNDSLVNIESIYEMEEVS